MQRNNLRKLITLFALLITSFTLSAQTIRLNGRVLNQKNEPIAGASISVSEISRSFAADIEGRFVIGLEAGKRYT
ncbi:MAG TPA: hypothetical protein VL946_12415, partial [Lacibacter sp.]|nr:hypothetical protein [Lacibacter sp.]